VIATKLNGISRQKEDDENFACYHPFYEIKFLIWPKKLLYVIN